MIIVNPTDLLRLPMAREHLRQLLASNAGLDPLSGFYAGGDDRATMLAETDDERVARMDYLDSFRLKAVSIIAGLIDNGHLAVWRSTEDGGLEPTAPLWAGQRFFEEDFSIDRLYLVREAWEAALTTFVVRPHPPEPPVKKPLSSAAWSRWADKYRRLNSPLPDVDRVIHPAAQAAFPDHVITQTMVRRAFGGGKRGPRQ